MKNILIILLLAGFTAVGATVYTDPVTSLGTVDGINYYEISYGTPRDYWWSKWDWENGGESGTGLFTNAVLSMAFNTNFIAGGTVYDSSLALNHGANGAGAAASTSVSNGTYYGYADFDGGDVVTITDAADLSFTDGGGNDQPCTFMMWVKQADFVTAQCYIGKWDTLYSGSAALAEYQFIFSGGNLYLQFASTDTTKNIYASAPFTAGSYSNVWTHIAGTYDGSENENNINIYINGVIASDGHVETGTYTGMGNTAVPVRVGSRWDDSAPNLPYEGELDELRLMSTTLTSNQVYTVFITGRGL